MREQVGPQKFFQQLKAQAPHYAKLLPELPLLLHQYLRRSAEPVLPQPLLAELLREQKRSNRMLQWLIALAIGFVLGLIAMQLMLRLRFF